MKDQFTEVDYVIPLDIPFERIVHRVRKMEDGTVAEIVGAESEIRLTKEEKFSYALNRKTGLVCLELMNFAGSTYPSCKEIFIDVAKAIDDSVIAASQDIVVNGQGTSFIFYRKDEEKKAGESNG